MRIRHKISAAALAFAALGLSACATGLDTRVTRFQAASIPAEQSFYVVPADGPAGAQFYYYASMLSQQLEARGFKPAGAPGLADMLVRLDYGVDEGRTEYSYDPFYNPAFGSGLGPYGWSGGGYYDPFYNSGYGIFYGRPYRSRWSSYPFYYGWNDPFGFGGYGGYGRYGRGIYDRYTVYKSHLDMNIVQRRSNASLFEGHAMAKSQTDNLNALVPNLIEAMFTGFPGRNGETVKITIPAKPKG